MENNCNDCKCLNCNYVPCGHCHNCQKSDTDEPVSNCQWYKNPANN